MKMQIIYNEVCKQIYQEAIEEILKALPKIITPKIEPPKNKLSQNQIFASGQMNMLLRVNEVLELLKKAK